jgi:hypothetical protein
VAQCEHQVALCANRNLDSTFVLSIYTDKPCPINYISSTGVVQVPATDQFLMMMLMLTTARN